MIAFCQLCGNQGSSLRGRLHHNGGIAHSCHYPVALHEVLSVRIGAAHEFGQQSAMVHHVDRRFPMGSRIDTVQSVCQYTNGGEAMFQGRFMGLDVDAVSQSAYNEHIGTYSGQVLDKRLAYFFSIGSGMTGAYHADDSQGIEGSISPIKQGQWSIFTLPETGWVGSIVQCQTLNLILLGKL